MIDYSFEDIACEAFGTEKELLFKNGKTDTNSSFARYLCFEHLYYKTNITLAEIGERYGNRDHSTIHTGLQKISELLTYKKFRLGYNHFKLQAENLNTPAVKELTQKEIDTIIFMKRNKIPLSKISAFYNIEEALLEPLIERMNVHNKTPKHIIEKMVQLYTEDKLNFKEIGLAVNRSTNTVSRLIKKELNIKNDNSKGQAN